MNKNFTLSDVINVPGDGDCFFHALKVGLDNIFSHQSISQHAEAKKLIGNITVEGLRRDIVEILLAKINVPIDNFKKIEIPIPGVKNEVWTLASYHGVDIGAGNDVYKMAKDQLIAHLNNMKGNGIFATDLEVFGAQLYFQGLMNTVRNIEGLQNLGEIKIGVYTPPRTNQNVSKGILEGNEGDRGENGAVIRIINESGYTVNGWHFDALPSTDFDGNLISGTKEKKDDPFKVHFEILKREMGKIKDEINKNKKNHLLIDQLRKNKEILINELINLHIIVSNIKVEAVQINPANSEYLKFPDEMNEYLNDQLINNNPENIDNKRDINFRGIKAGIGLKIEIPLFAKLGIAKYCCKTGGGIKKKHKRKAAKKTKGKTKRKWSKKIQGQYQL